MSEPILKLEGISKSFAGVNALIGVDFDVRPGEVHALLGENGAGKSTLIKIITGVHQPTRGTIMVDGKPVAVCHAARGAAPSASPRSTRSRCCSPT